MKTAQGSSAAHSAYRTNEVSKVLAALSRYRLEIVDRVVIDFGCHDGALSSGYLHAGAARVIGLDVDDDAIAKANEQHRDPRLTFCVSTTSAVPLPNSFADAALSYDVFEHVSAPSTIAREIFRVLKPGGFLMVGTWSWRHPFAPHLWATMPVPWAHLLVSDMTLMKACRRVYSASWYQPTRHDFDEQGRRILDKYTETGISRDYLNRYLIRDFERAFRSAGFNCETNCVPFGSVPWSAPLLRVAWFRDFLAGYVWFVLRKP